ncbi:hypothetical protein HY406_01640 [Candidatus Giovannonibacteria bacterium]|nr:hypothetical protein [Candidatus Giovannonibacteria bacterium]
MDFLELENEIRNIKERNLRVEADKAWETSITRKLFVAVLTYLVAASLFVVLGVERPLLGALVPTAAFALSTLSLGAIKKIWLKKLQRNRN